MTRLTAALKKKNLPLVQKIIAGSDWLAKIDFFILVVTNIFLMGLASLQLISQDYFDNNLKFSTSYLNIPDKVSNYTPLELACLLDLSEIAQSLLNKGLRFPQNSQAYQGLARQAVFNGNIRLFKKLYKAGAQDLFKDVNNGLTLLQYLVLPGYNLTVLTNLFEGLSPHKRTQLIKAHNNFLGRFDVKQKRAPICANFMHYPGTGFAVPTGKQLDKYIHYAKYRYELQHGSALFYAVLYNSDQNFALIKLLLNYGANPNEISLFKGLRFTPFSLAVFLDKENMALTMLDNGARIFEPRLQAFESVFNMPASWDDETCAAYQEFLLENYKQAVFNEDILPKARALEQKYLRLQQNSAELTIIPQKQISSASLATVSPTSSTSISTLGLNTPLTFSPKEASNPGKKISVVGATTSKKRWGLGCI